MSYLVIAEIIKTHGLNGELSCEIHTDFPERFNTIESVKILDRKEKLLFDLEIDSVRFFNKRVNIKFKNIDTIEKAEELRGYFIAIDEKDALELPEDSYYFHDLIGLEVYNEDGKYIGRISKCYRISSSDIIDIDTRFKEIISLPFLKKFIKKVDIDNNRIELYNLEFINSDEH